MKLGIMQPYFLPYLGYYSLIEATDQFILFDIVQYIRHGWIERNQVLNNKNESFYIKVPLEKHSRSTTIQNINIKNSQRWQDTILAQLSQYKKKSKYYTQVVDMLKHSFETTPSNITELNSTILKTTCEYLDMNAKIETFSDMNITLPDVNAPDEWALYISKHMKATEYINPEGGKTFFNVEKYQNENISIKFLKQELRPYKQFTDEFTPGMSIIDVLMFNSINDTKELINAYNVE